MSGLPILKPHALGLVLSYQCQNSCAHCLYNCGPAWKDWMEPQNMRLALENARQAWGDGFSLHITGGEPFFHFPLLLETAQTAAQLHIPTCVETNAAWCTCPNLVEDYFQQLKDAGVASLRISCSPLHAEHIPVERTRLAIQAALRIFGPIDTCILLPEWMEPIAAFSTSQPVPLQRYMDQWGNKATGERLWKEFGLIGGGRCGYRLGHLVTRYRALMFQGENCSTELLHASHAHLDLYGNTMPGYCSGISLGNWATLGELITQLEANQLPPLVDLLTQNGPYGLFQLAAEDAGYVERPSGYADKCHLCVDVRRHLAEYGDWRELAPLRLYSLPVFE